MSVESDLYQEVVIEHKRSPRNFGKLAAPTQQARGTNPQCGDDLSVELQVEGELIRDIRFSGQGCAICVASASLMTEAVKGGSVDAAQQLQRRFRAVLMGQHDAQDGGLGKLVSLAGVQRYPSRIKCALLGWHALGHALGQAGAAHEPGDAGPVAQRP